MKVCKFEKIKDEDEMKQVINCIQKEHPYVAVVPLLAQLQEMNIDYLQNNFGVDLLKEERPCMFYTADNMVVGRNDTLLYLYNYETQQELTYDIGNGKLNAVPMDDSFLPLKEYSFSMLQSAEFLVKHGKTLNSIPFTQQ